MDRKSVINKLYHYINLLRENGIDISKAFLYGSYARGENDESSDIDLMLVSEIFDNENDKAIGLAWRLTRKVDARIEPYLVGLNKFTDDDISPLLQLVKNEGIPLL